MTTPVFPVLAGQGWSVHKKPTFATIVAPHASGREVRDALYVNPIWEFETSFDGLDSSSSSYPGLGAQSLQSLMGLFLQCQGQFGTFLYYDPTDYSVSGQVFGTGDGSTTSFQLLRTLGGFAEWVTQPLAPSVFSIFTLPGSTRQTPNNVFQNSVALTSGLTPLFVTLTGGQTDPNGGALAALVTETTATNYHVADQNSQPVIPGYPVIFSMDLKQNGSVRYWQLNLDNGGTNGVYANFDLTGGAVTSSGSYGSASGLKTAISSLGGGWYRCSVSCVMDNTSTAARTGISGINNVSGAGAFPSYAGSASNSVYVAFPQTELALAVGAPTSFNPTLSTRYYGGPSITVAGTYLDPSTYSISNGLVTFGSAPAASAAIAWSGYFGFLCRFAQDDIDFEEFMQNLWNAKSVKFRSVRAQ